MKQRKIKEMGRIDGKFDKLIRKL